MDEEPSPASKRCFMIAPIGSTGSETRNRSDKILRHVVRPVLEPIGYKVDRADEIDRSGQITSQVVERISNDELVVADLTDLNPNVFYELALRHALRKPFVQIAETGTTLPFDLHSQRTIMLDHRDLDSVAEARERIANAVRELENGAPVETPISIALDLQDLRGSADPEEQGIAQVIESVSRMEAVLTGGHYGRDRLDTHGNFRAMRKFIEKLGKEGRLVPDDEFDIMTLDITSERFQDWVRHLSFSPKKTGHKIGLSDDSM